MQMYEIKFNFMYNSVERILYKGVCILRLQSLCRYLHKASGIYYYMGTYAAATAHLYELHIHVLYTRTEDIKYPQFSYKLI